MTLERICKSPEETGQVAREVASRSKAGDVYALIGDLGSGKTHFAKAFAAEIGITEEITSPTYTLLEEYSAPLPLYHFDLYRIEHEVELDYLDFEEYWEGSGISLVEWADRAPGRLPETAVIVRFYYIDENTRRIVLEYPDN
ncbi:MAG: tRNA (adenosine(37)-N6)-threonylcarbamoyltransferase complex ATPase subunit type 1 TsaE [Spirochaetota bacterium]